MLFPHIERLIFEVDRMCIECFIASPHKTNLVDYPAIQSDSHLTFNYVCGRMTKDEF